MRRSLTIAVVLLSLWCMAAVTLINLGPTNPQVVGVLGVANGGSALSTRTAHALYVGNGGSAETALSVGATNTVLHGITSNNPSFSAVVVGDVDNTITGFSASNTSSNAMSSAATDTKLVEFSPGAGYFNTANKVFHIHATGTWTTGTTQTPTWNFKVKLCTVSGCGSGTALTLLTWTSAASTASTTQRWVIDGDCGITTTGGSGTLLCHGLADTPVGASSGTLAAAITGDANTANSSTIDLTAALFVDVMANVSTQSGTKNSCTYHTAKLGP